MLDAISNVKVQDGVHTIRVGIRVNKEGMLYKMRSSAPKDNASKQNNYSQFVM